ncbi:uncharacterized protein LOC110461960 isoform X2 [Mizuhopecten yessoensis]|uniref:uncharacterized protein LOC110461960 isoform X2 n=1 Tax=Mizuhopecten yessoensis TaxID=6573 RepID=UPI000B45CF85|nr:uncharacterized protein LOC110461960 isoform X2 [Mizuhopecten yessoensis]XP_021371385.1 uncharacterized protein LOC110461960 isoform X2 [Mizuhopecten yessoensis]
MTELNTEGDSIGPTDSVPAPKPVSSNNDAFQALDLFTTYLDAKLKGLRDDIREEHDLSANSFKRLKKEREVKFKFNGNKKQFDFNSEVLEEVELAEKAVVKGDSSSTRDSLRNIRTLLEKRNKLIRIADKSVCGWDTVNEYQSDELASDSEDEKKIRQAEFRAQRKKRSTKKSTPAAAGGPPGRQHGPQYMPGAGNTHDSFRGFYHQWQQQRPASGRFQRGGFWPQFGGRGRGTPGPNDLCHACGGVGHWRTNCPKLSDSAGK